MQVRRSHSVFSWLLVSLAFASLALTAWAERVEDLPKPTNYVSDFAHVLSPAAAARLNRLCGQLDHSATNAQVAVVIVRNLDGDDKADFANRLEEKWKVGKKGTDRGILMLISVEDRHYWIEIGYGLEGILPDAKVGDIGRLMAPHLRQRDYDGAVTTGLTQIADVIAADAKVTLQTAPPPPEPIPQQPHRSGSPIGLIIRIVLIGLVLLFLGARGLFGFGLGFLFGGGWGGGGGGGWGGGNSGGGGNDSGGSGFDGFGGGDSGGGGAGGDY